MRWVDLSARLLRYESQVYAGVDCQRYDTSVCESLAGSVTARARPHIHMWDSQGEVASQFQLWDSSGEVASQYRRDSVPICGTHRSEVASHVGPPVAQLAAEYISSRPGQCALFVSPPYCFSIFLYLPGLCG